MNPLWKIIFLFIYASGINAQDWPVYKGNLYLTGNNDEIIVKNNHIRWIQQASHPLYNPVVSSGKIYVLDKSAMIYCLDEESGHPLWSVSLPEISRKFTGTDKNPGKIKYPVIKNRFMIISDATMIYAFDKDTGNVIWSRTAMQNEKTPEKVGRAVIEGIYSDPTLHGEEILYGTRGTFIARDINNGHLLWNRTDIKSYSGFPVFYDDYIFTQSMDYSAQKYYLFNLDLKTGRENWITELEKPFKIFSPVVYNQKVYLPIGMKIYALSLDTGKILWQKDYREYVTSEISFSDRDIYFSLNNRDIVSADPDTGDIKTRVGYLDSKSPYFVITRDQVYIAANKLPPEEGAEKNNPEKPSAMVRAFSKDSVSSPLWEFTAPFPGAVSQPVSSRGVMFLPAGNYLYALGDSRPSELIREGDAYFLKKTGQDGAIEKTRLFEDLLSPQPPQEKPDKNQEQPEKIRNSEVAEAPAKIPERTIRLSSQDENGNSVDSEAEVIYRKDGKIVYKKTMKLNKKDAEVQIPDVDNVEINSFSRDHAPSKTIVNRSDSEKIIPAAKIAKGESFSLDNVGFETNRAYLKDDALEILNRTADFLKAHPDLKIQVRGHTDSTGDTKYNQVLSEKRAETVRDYLIKRGISPLRLDSRGYGDTKPVAHNSTEEGRSRNRRTEFYILK